MRRVRHAHQPIRHRSERAARIGVQGDGPMPVSRYACDVRQALDGITSCELALAELLVESEADQVVLGRIVVPTHEPKYVTDPQVTDRFAIWTGLPRPDPSASS